MSGSLGPMMNSSKNWWMNLRIAPFASLLHSVYFSSFLVFLELSFLFAASCTFILSKTCSSVFFSAAAWSNGNSQHQFTAGTAGKATQAGGVCVSVTNRKQNYSLGVGVKTLCLGGRWKEGSRIRAAGQRQRLIEAPSPGGLTTRGRFVCPGGPADGRLIPGDQLVKINNVAVDDLTPEQAAEIIRSLTHTHTCLVTDDAGSWNKDICIISEPPLPPSRPVFQGVSGNVDHDGRQNHAGESGGL